MTFKTITDYPIIAEARCLVLEQNNNPDKDIIYTKLATASSIHDFATAFIALWVWKGVEPDIGIAVGSRFQFKALGVAYSIMGRVSRGDGVLTVLDAQEKEFKGINDVQYNLAKPVYSGVAGAMLIMG